MSKKEAVRVVLYRYQNRILQIFLGKRPDWSKLEADKYQLIGGQQKKDEIPINAAAREIIEEILEFKPKDLASLVKALALISEFPNDDTGWLTTAFLMEVEKITLDTQEMPTADWFSIEQLGNLKLAFDHLLIIEDFLKLITKN